MKSFIPNIANGLGIGVYSMQERDRTHIACFFSVKRKEATLFLFFRIVEEVKLLSGSDDIDFTHTNHVLDRLFGEAGKTAIVDAVSAQMSDADAIKIAKWRGYILAQVAIGNVDILKNAPEFKAGVIAGREFLALDPNMGLDDDIALAFWGLHYLWFSKHVMSEDFKEWIQIMKNSDAATEALDKMFKMMNPK